jgi:hypothetical protein
MNHKYVVEKGIIENYLLHRLNEKETDDFEEHLLYCKECRSLLAETKEIMTLTQYMAIHSSKNETDEGATQKGISLYRTCIKAAAIIFVIVCSAGIIWSLLQKPKESLVRNESKHGQIKNVPDSAPNEVVQSVKSLSQTELTRENDSLSGNYKKLALYENAIKNNLRGENIEVLSPKKSTQITFGEKVVFSLKDNKQEILITVINNTGKTLFENMVKIPYTLQLKLPRGLYYWEITENDEVVFVSKFLIR